MDTVGENTQAGGRPGGQDAPQGPGKSGEGSRSAMEQLIQQERKREAQRLREGSGSGSGELAGSTP